MSYTAPLGSAVDFVFTDAAYTAPSGSAVDFLFGVDVEGACFYQIPLVATGTGIAQVDGQASVELLDAYATDIPWRSGVGRATLVIAATGDGDELYPLGTGTAALSVSSFGSGYGPVSGELLRELRLMGYATGSAAAGYGAAAVEISATAEGISPQLGVGNAAGLITATATGAIGRAGFGVGRIHLLGSGSAASLVGHGRVINFLRSTGSGRVSRSGAARAQLPLRSSAAGAHGVSGYCSGAFLHAAASGTVFECVSGLGAAESWLRGQGIGTHPKLPQQGGQLFIRSKPHALQVFTNGL